MCSSSKLHLALLGFILKASLNFSLGIPYAVAIALSCGVTSFKIHRFLSDRGSYALWAVSLWCPEMVLF